MIPKPYAWLLRRSHIEKKGPYDHTTHLKTSIRMTYDIFTDCPISISLYDWSKTVKFICKQLVKIDNHSIICTYYRNGSFHWFCPEIFGKNQLFCSNWNSSQAFLIKDCLKLLNTSSVPVTYHVDSYCNHLG